MVCIRNRLIAKFPKEMPEFIELPGDVPQFLSESEFNYFPLMSPEETRLDSAALPATNCFLTPQSLHNESNTNERESIPKGCLHKPIPISQIRKGREFKEKRTSPKSPNVFDRILSVSTDSRN